MAIIVPTAEIQNFRVVAPPEGNKQEHCWLMTDFIVVFQTKGRLPAISLGTSPPKLHR
jgi:hypothetical protein